MNQSHLTEICKVFELGASTSTPTRVYGGLLHLMWRVDTDKASYAIKQLSQAIDLKNECVRKNYELSEQVAARFSEQGIQAISAIERAGKHLIEIDSEAYLVYPWINARALDNDTISEKHALKIASLIAQIHLINLDVPEIQGPEFEVHSIDKLIELINKSLSHNFSFAKELKANLKQISVINEMHQSAVPLLNKQVVVSHGDLDQKNVLWDGNGSPFIIDWEAARKVNPTHEIIAVALDWSGLMRCVMDKNIFTEMLRGYQACKGMINQTVIDASIYCYLGNGLNWLKFNLERVMNNSPHSGEHTIGKEQVRHTLGVILYLYENKNAIKDLISEVIS